MATQNDIDLKNRKTNNVNDLNTGKLNTINH